MTNFKEQRKKAGLRQEKVGTQLGVTQGLVSQWETGRCLPRADLLPKIAVLYGCSVDELLSINVQDKSIMKIVDT
ncbi:MAG: helix-turn-helix domain-containing protein [Defluviitaleaceae bacterium]|nr:helix-turn-helix domain-containing protein [Defluviitaleaceae bacterium]